MLSQYGRKGGPQIVIGNHTFRATLTEYIELIMSAFYLLRHAERKKAHRKRSSFGIRKQTEQSYSYDDRKAGPSDAKTGNC